MALIWQGKAWRLFTDLDLLKALPCVVRSRVDAILADNVLDFLMFTGSDDLVLAFGANANGLASFLVLVLIARIFFATSTGST